MNPLVNKVCRLYALTMNMLYLQGLRQGFETVYFEFESLYRNRTAVPLLFDVDNPVKLPDSLEKTRKIDT